MEGTTPMLTARERAEMMADRIQWSGDETSYEKVTFRRFLFGSVRGDAPVMWLESSGGPRRALRPLVDYLEECLDAHERERDHRAVPRALLPSITNSVKETGSVAQELTDHYGFVWDFIGMVWHYWPDESRAIRTPDVVCVAHSHPLG